MDLHQLECFICAAQYNNVTKAASEMHISQPAMSTLIQSLEKELGVCLFDRNGKKIILNETGRLVLNHAQAIMGECATIKKICREASIRDKEKVIVLPAVTSWIVPYLLNDFGAIHPEIYLEFVLVDYNVKKLVNSMEADIIIGASIENISNENTCSVAQEEIMLAIPLDHELAGRDEIDLIELKNYKIISPTKDRPFRGFEDYFCELAGFTPIRSMECDTLRLLRDLIENGHGPAFVPVISWRSLNLTKSRLVRIRNPRCFRYITVSYGSKKSRKTPAVENVYSYIVSLFERVAQEVGRETYTGARYNDMHV